MIPQIGSWASQASHLIGDCYDSGMPILGTESTHLSGLPHFLSAQLFVDCHLTSESILLLLQQGKEWDAEILLRSVIEGSLKLDMLLRGTIEQREETAYEFWEVLPIFHQVRHAEHAKKILDIVEDPESTEWRSIKDLMLDEASLSRIRATYSKAQRQALEEKWSFVGLIREFVKLGGSGAKEIVGLGHGYAMSSHLLHKDADGIGMVWERSRRNTERREAVTLGHAARIIHDVCGFSKLRLLIALNACNLKSETFRKLGDKYAALYSSLQDAVDEFNRIEYEDNG